MKKLVVITGASSGIGKALAIKFSNEGYPLLLLARRIELLEQLKLSNTICKKVDITNFKEFEKAIEFAQTKYGPVDLMINNAGVMYLEQFINQDINQLDEMINTNIKGVMYGMKLALSTMTKEKQGTIVNISSVAGRWTFNNHAVYNASKFAVHALSEAVRKELSKTQQNIRIIIVGPGIVQTDLLSHTTNDKIIENYNIEKNSLNGGLTPEEISDTIYFAYTRKQHINMKEILISHTNEDD